jgi:hypothetical protein
MTSVNKKIGFIYGLILGAILIILRVYIYFVDLNLLVNVWLGFFTIILFVLFGILSILAFKGKIGGLITFKQSFSTYFFTIAVGHFLSCLAVIIICNLLISQETQESIKIIITNFNISILKQNNSSLKDINSAIEISKNYNPSTIIEIISSSVTYLLRDCIIALFVSLIFRNKKEI